MSNNPFSKFIVDPSKVPNPNTIQPSQLEQYTSLEMQKMQQSMKVYKRSAIYLAGCIGLGLITALISEKSRRSHIFGEDTKCPIDQGGSYLDIKTTHDESHYAYNREFQRMLVTAQPLTPDVPKTSERLLTDLGVEVPRKGNHEVPRKAPHEKFY